MRGTRAWAVGKTLKRCNFDVLGAFFGPGFLEVPVRGSRCRKKQDGGEGRKNKKHKFGGDALMIREKREWEIKSERNKVEN